MISAVCWVRKGSAKPVPETYEPTDEDMRKMQGEAAEELEAEEEEEEEPAPEAEMDATLREKYNMDDYDSSDPEDDPGVLPMFRKKHLMHHKANADDPYITLQVEDDDSDIDDFTLRPTDSILLGARSDEDVANIEVYVYEELEDNIYNHHNILLPTFPLAIEWLDFRPSSAVDSPASMGNFVAVGTFVPQIEIWDLDVVEAPEPSALLGSLPQEVPGPSGGGSSKKGKKKNKQKQAAASSNTHTDAVMGLSWNRQQRHILASCSADRTIQLWDLTTPTQSVQTLRHHTDKVQAVTWNPVEASVMLSGAFDKTVVVTDVRAPDAVRRWSVLQDVECVTWNPQSPQYLLASTEDGMVTCFDARMGDNKVWALGAHSEACTGLSFNPAAPNVFATGSADRTVKLWSLNDGAPTMLHSKHLNVGAVFDVKFNPDSPALLGVGGGNGKVVVWNTLTVKEMQQALGMKGPDVDEGDLVSMAGMESLDIHSSDSEDEEEMEQVIAQAEAQAPPPLPGVGASSSRSGVKVNKKKKGGKKK